MNYAIEQRIRLIDFLLHYYGYINLIMIMDYFGISKPCASRDIKDYLNMNNEGVFYNKNLKHYATTKDFNSIYFGESQRGFYAINHTTEKTKE